MICFNFEFIFSSRKSLLNHDGEVGLLCYSVSILNMFKLISQFIVMSADIL